jgi:hypothetical protein
MTAPPFNLETALGWFSLTVVDERRIIATAPARGIALLMMGGDQLSIRVELQPDHDGVWRPLRPADVLVIRRVRGVQRDSEPDQRLHQMIIDALSAAVTAWAAHEQGFVRAR